MPDEELDFVDANPPDAQVHVESYWRKQLPAKTSTGMVTEALPQGTVGVQTIERDTVGIQTGVDPEQRPKAKATPGLQTFMNNVLPLVQTEMKKVDEEHEILEPLNRVVDDKQEPATCTLELSAWQESVSFDASMSASGAARSKLVVTSLSWSATGQTVAAAYGRYDIPGWCSDRGALVTWNLARESINQNRPDITIDVDNCLMSCAFHPEHPALIAGGTFNGDVYIWDLSLEGDMQRGKTDALSDMRHREPICSMVWQYSLTEYNKYGNKTQAYRLITLGADGLVMIWTWHKLQTALFGYKLVWPQPGTNLKITHGGSCMSMLGDPQQRQMGGAATFMVGTEGGRVFKCYMDLNDAALKDFAKAATAGETVDMRSPIKEADYSTHAGAVRGLECSPFQKDLFLTAGYDGCIHLHHSLKQQHLLELVPTDRQLQAIHWSPVRPLVFAAASSDGNVYFYDLMRTKGMLSPALTMDASPDGRAVYACAFNARRPEWFATGGASGIQIWKLPESLASAKKGEEGVLRRLAAADDVDDVLRQQQRL